MKILSRLTGVFVGCSLLFSTFPVWANLPGGGTGTGAAVTLVNNGNGTATMANGIVSIVITTGNANLQQIYYTYNNSGTPVTNQMLAGGYAGGKLYWENAGFGSGSFTYSVVANTGDYCEVDLSSPSRHGCAFLHAARFAGVLCDADLESPGGRCRHGLGRGAG